MSERIPKITNRKRRNSTLLFREVRYYPLAANFVTGRGVRPALCREIRRRVVEILGRADSFSGEWYRVLAVV